MKSKKKEQNFVGSYSLRKELSLVPSYLVLVLWVGFTAVILLWVIAASLSTTSDIFTGNVFGFTSGVHIENYARAWTAGNVSVFFMNSLIYSVISCALLILVCAPYSYVLQRFQFPGSVSYTHLDVYKRQMLYSTCTSCATVMGTASARMCRVTLPTEKSLPDVVCNACPSASASCLFYIIFIYSIARRMLCQRGPVSAGGGTSRPPETHPAAR